MLNLHSLFNGSSTIVGLNQKLSITEVERKKLTAARDVIRDALRKGLPALLKQKYPDIKKVPTPKFHTQGSWAYGTLIWPAHIPPQQADMDDGCYMPLSFMKDAQPDIASKFFFEAVEAVLAPVAKAHGWKINPNGAKATCTRIQLDNSKHIDIPLYAIPDQEYEKIVEAFVKTAQARTGNMDFAADEWDLLPADALLLAHREEGWKKSDPRPLRDWVNQQVMLKTEQVRRLMRYVKAWRDWIWPKGNSPSSILLMVAVDEALSDSKQRDDVALLEVAHKLPAILRGEVENPVSPDEYLTDKLDEDNIREEVVARAQEMYRTLHYAIMVCDQPDEACRSLQTLFGPRFPADANAVEKVKAATVVASVPPRKIEKEPLVGRSQAG